MHDRIGGKCWGTWPGRKLKKREQPTAFDVAGGLLGAATANCFFLSCGLWLYVSCRKVQTGRMQAGAGGAAAAARRRRRRRLGVPRVSPAPTLTLALGQQLSTPNTTRLWPDGWRANRCTSQAHNAATAAADGDHHDSQLCLCSLGVTVYTTLNASCLFVSDCASQDRHCHGWLQGF